MSDQIHIHKGGRKPPSPWFLLLSVLLIGVAVFSAQQWVARAAAGPSQKGSVSAMATHVPQLSTLPSPTPSQGAPLPLQLQLGQDTALPAEQDLAIDSAQNTQPQPDSTGVIRVHNGFASLSIEAFHTCNYVIEPIQNTMANLVDNFGRGGIMRVGGGSVDSTDWDATSTTPCQTSGFEDTPTLTPPMLDKFFRFMHRVGWKVIWSVGLQLTPAQAASEAATAVQISHNIAPGGAGPLLAIAIGNEPEIDLSNPDGSAVTYQQFRTIWETDAKAIRAQVPTVKFAAPDMCCTDNDQWFLNFMPDDGSQVQIATYHLYPLFSSDTHTPTIAELLDPSTMQGQMDTIDHVHQAATAQHLPLLMSETNSIANTPTPEVGLAFAQSLWTGDYLFTAQEHGVLGLNFHGGASGDATSPTAGDGMTEEHVQATYYGMLLYRQAAAAGGHVLPITFNPGSLNVTAHAIRGCDGKLYVALFNKGSQDVNMQVASGRSAAQRASVLRMTAPSVQSQTGILLGGAAVASNGTWSGHYDSVPVSGNVASLSLPAYSAALLVLQPA